MNIIRYVILNKLLESHGIHKCDYLFNLLVEEIKRANLSSVLWKYIIFEKR